jgi:hypothetical protein
LFYVTKCLRSKKKKKTLNGSDYTTSSPTLGDVQIKLRERERKRERERERESERESEGESERESESLYHTRYGYNNQGVSGS